MSDYGSSYGDPWGAGSAADAYVPMQSKEELDAFKRMWTDPVASSSGPSASGSVDVPMSPFPVPYSGSAQTNYNKAGQPVGVQAQGQEGWATQGKTDPGDLPFGATAQGAAQYGASGYAGLGSYTDPSGTQWHGADASARSSYAEGNVKVGNTTVGGDVTGPSASAGASFSDSTAHIGAQANAASASFYAGTSDKNSATDEYGRVGVSEGVGADARVHYGDADGDGHKEYGFGADIGPFSFDVKTEDPLRTLANGVANAATFGLPIGSALMNQVDTNPDGTPANMTDQAVAAAKSAASAVGDVASSAVNTAGDLWNWVTE